MKTKVFISYSNKDHKIQRYIHNALVDGLDDSSIYDIVFDKQNIKAGEIISNSIKDLINDVDILIPIISEDSLKSEWVQFEIMTFMHNMSIESNLKLLPVVIDSCNLPGYLSNISMIDMRDPKSYSESLNKLISRIKNDDNYSQYDASIYKRTLKSDAEDYRIQNMIQGAVDISIADLKTKISAIVNSMQKQQYILSPESIAIRESEALEEIWVLTNHLYNDTEDEKIKESVKENFRRGLTYTYFITKSELIKRRKRKFEKIFGPWKNQYNFIYLNKGMVLPFDEIVLYDPLDTPRVWGYFQIKYPILKNDDDLFLELSKSHRVGIAKDLQNLKNKKK